MAKLTRVGLMKMENDGVPAGFVKEMHCVMCGITSNVESLHLRFLAGEVKAFCPDHKDSDFGASPTLKVDPPSSPRPKIKAIKAKVTKVEEDEMAAATLGSLFG